MIRALVLLLLVAVVGAGGYGAWGYADQYARYRGFGPPVQHQPPAARGRLVTVWVRSPALGGRPARVVVYLPAAYRTAPARRFPTLYLLQGMPGTSVTAFLDAFHVASVLDDEIAAGRLAPMIAVVPPGSWGSRDFATEWADGPRPGTHWDTFLARDVVRAVDARFRTIRRASARGVAGYSAGANEAANALILHPGTFRLAEAWSGDFTQTARLVRHDAVAVRRYSALETVAAAAPRLRRLRARFLVYVGRTDRDYRPTVRFVTLLRRAGLDPTFWVLPGGHSWKLWHDELPDALRFFSQAQRDASSRPLRPAAPVARSAHATPRLPRRRAPRVRPHRRRASVHPPGRLTRGRR